MRLPRARGRPPGKYNSHADYKLLLYLAHISGEYGIEPNNFFNSFVKAWKNQKSIYNSLLIECRDKTSDGAVFLITHNSKVVAQFPIPTHILEKTNPLKEFANTNKSRRKASKRNIERHLQIEDLESGMKRINLKAKVLEIPKPRSVFTRFGEFAVVANASIADETGVIQLPLWNRQIGEVSVGDIVRVENASVVTFRGKKQLKIGRGGQLNIIEK